MDLTHGALINLTLKIRNNRKALNTERPKDPPFISDQMTSNIDPLITTQSKRLKEDSKYILGPNAYIFTHISVINSAKNAYSAISVSRRRLF